mmetsp:Transcript_20783/g.41586  ORF Transcript_20783/g.41586 Transcript_20783/m.41586 type:complete len:382 (+) Transcript_20783:143-1288(+)
MSDNYSYPPSTVPLPFDPSLQHVLPENNLSRAQICSSPQVAETLHRQGYTKGLISSMTSSVSSFPLRIWIVDNSGSMQQTDGSKIAGNRDNLKFVPSSRWDEIRECIIYHAEMAGLLHSSTVFRMLNIPGVHAGPQMMSIAERGPDAVAGEVDTVRNCMYKSRPGGCTPLAQHLREIREIVDSMSTTLRAGGQKVAVIIATDGLPTDSNGYQSKSTRDEFVNELMLLGRLPVWIVVRLCTDDEAVVTFYNDLDGQLENDIEVIDDFRGEAQEIYEHNKWLNYALPLHRIRERGFHDRLLDLLDERPLTGGEVRDFCALLFGTQSQEDLPDPSSYDEFRKALKTLIGDEEMQWNPIKGKRTPWVDLHVIDQLYGPPRICVIS